MGASKPQKFCRMAYADGQGSARRRDDTTDLETRAVTLCRVYGAGSPEYASFLEEVNSTLLGATLTFPKFIPGDIKNAATSKGRKKKKQHKRRSQQNEAARMATAAEGRQNGAQKLERVDEEATRSHNWETAGAKGRNVQRSLTSPTKEKTLKEHFRALRRSVSMLDDAEQSTMDEQVALQLQTLVREKAELIKENSRLKNENEGLKTLLEYATLEATADDGEESEYETKEVLRRPGIQAWHPPEIQSPTSFSSYGMLGSTSSSTEDKDQTQVTEETYHLARIRT